MTTYGIERYLNIRSAYGASVGPDGDELAFLMNTTGVPQIWTLDAPQSWPEQRTFFDERISFASWSPERPELVFGMDDGGNERAQLYRLDATTGHIENLTRHPDAKHRWGGWSHDGDYFAFTSNRRDESVFDVYCQHRTDIETDATCCYEGDGWLTVSGFDPTDSRLLVSKAHSNFDQDLYVLDLDTGDLEHLTPHEGSVRYQSASWAPTNSDDWTAGDGLYLVTDHDGDTLSLAFLDLDTRDVVTVADGTDVDTARTAPSTPADGWNVDGIALDDETGRFVYSTNVDGYTRLTVGEFTGEDPTAIETYPTPALPGGITGGVSFGPDASWFACSTTGDTINTNVFVVDVETGNAERWTNAPTAGIPRESFYESALVHVESFDGLSVHGFLSIPADSEPNGGPVLIDIHGGPESQRRPSFSSLKQYFLQEGFAYFEPNVRGSSGYGAEYASLDDVDRRMDSVADIGACAEWLQSHSAIDPDRIACMGGSYGGFMVLASLIEYPEYFAAGIDIVGIANFVTFLENTGEWRRALREAEYGSLETDRDLLVEISPIHDVDRIEAPLFVLHGENDPRVPLSEAEQIVEAAREQGVPVNQLFFDDEGHGISKLENRIEAYTEIAAFLNEHV